MKIINLLFLASLLTFISCDNSTKDDSHQHQTDATENLQHDTEEIDNNVLHLNKGEKWTVNDATQVGMLAIQKLLNEYTASEGTDYANLGASMSDEASNLISKCDMVGIDHDQLHLILHPILESIDAIKENGSSASLEALGAQLTMYFNHFQLKQ